MSQAGSFKKAEQAMARIPAQSRNSIDGHPAADHPLSVRSTKRLLPGPLGRLINHPVRPLYDQENSALPRRLAALRRQVRHFAETELSPVALEADQQAHGKPGELPPVQARVLTAAARAGLFTDLLPWPLGSASPLLFLNSPGWQICIKTEELARGCGGLMLLIMAHSLGVSPVLIGGGFGAFRRFVRPAFRETLTGNPHLFAFAITEPGLGSDAEEGHGASHNKPGVVARKTKGGYRLSGRKCFISGGDIARSITVFAALENEGIESWTCFLVPNPSAGLTVQRNELKMGMRASSASELLFDDVFVPRSHIIGGRRKGWALNRVCLNFSRLPVASMAVGLAQQALEIARDFACGYRLGGRPLINYQEIQLQLADMTAATSSIRSLVWSSARSHRLRSLNTAMCKFYCTDVATAVADEAMDLLSNHGVLGRNLAEKNFRDVRLTRIFEGTNQINRLALIEDMQEDLLHRMQENP